jgi:hypothetical protein
MQKKESLLTIFAIVFGVCLTGAGAWAIFLSVWGYTSNPDESGAVLSLILFVPGVLFLLGGFLLLLRAYRGPRKSGK